ncbi:DUF1289 domain-containing protein [Janthinobacterium sp. HH107]|uniref:DUF1289 domain-containing protein n=1 Tax=Janthinobacterium sp. HH107 TaxID=1537279 RepID=UPI0031BB0996
MCAKYISGTAVVEHCFSGKYIHGNIAGRCHRLAGAVSRHNESLHVYRCRSMMVAPPPPPAVPLSLPSPVPSPCVSLCKMNRNSGLCEGCLRTLDEIIAWSKADDDFKRAVWAELPGRESLLDFEPDY